MTFTAALKRRREAFLDAHADAGDFMSRYFSGSTLTLWRTVAALHAENCRGLVLDAGSGRGAWRRGILETAGGYESIDVAPRGGDRPTWIGNICCMPEVPDGRYDTVVCHQVLEHVPRPWDAVREFHRVLRPGGRIIVSVPHLSRRHELPHDYFRYTQEGLGALLSEAGFTDIRVQAVGGPLCFLHHQVAFLFPGLLTGIPVLQQAAAMVNAPVSWLLAGLDRVADAGALLPNGVAATAVRS